MDRKPAAPGPRWWAVFLAAGTAAFLTKILLSVNTYGTNDVYAYERFATWSHDLGVELYRVDPSFNHPPFMIHALGVLLWLSKATRIPFQFWVRLPAILADAGGLLLLLKILGPRLADRSVALAAIAAAAAPPLILISGFHGNTDPVMVFFLLFSVYLIDRKKPAWAGGAAFGLAMSIKVVPLILVPMFFFRLAKSRRYIGFFAAAAGVMLVLWSPFVFQDPEGIVRRVFGYTSYYGYWGLSSLALRVAPPDSWINTGFQRFGTWLLLGGIAILSYWMNRLPRRPSLYSQAGAVFLLFLAFTNGFGPQYLAWLVPWTVGLGVLAAGFYVAASGLYVFLLYNSWAKGLPWYVADANLATPEQSQLDYFQYLCWFSVLFCLYLAIRQIRMEGIGKRAPVFTAPVFTAPGFANRAAIALIAVGLIAIGVLEDRASIPFVNAREQNVDLMRAQNFLALSTHLRRRGRYRDSVAAARQGANLDPGSFKTWASISNSYVHLGMWDEAVGAARKALRIRPGFQPAVDDLDLALRRGGQSRRIGQ